MDSKALPTELDDCHRLIATLQSQVDDQASVLQQQSSELRSKQTQLALKENLLEEQAHSVLELKENNGKFDKKVTVLTLKLEKPLQQLYGRKRERRIDGAGQLLLDLGEEASPEVVSALEEAIREAEQGVESAEDEKKKRRPKRSRKDDRNFTEHLPRYERIFDIPEELRKGLKFLGYDETQTLEWIRPELRVRLNKYAKYAHPADKSKGIISPERPVGLVEGDRFDASIGVEVVAWKYFCHLPFYRQQDLFAGSGWTPSGSTLQNIEASFGDCWLGFQKTDVRSDSPITFAACWAHARRKIDEFRGAFPIQFAKLESLIRMLYGIDNQIKDLDAAERLSRRQSLPRHVLGLIEQYLESDTMSVRQVLPKSNLNMAAAYVRRHWKALHRFTEDASIPIDNNDCEQLMKRVATGRKNWMFKGSLAAGERATNLMTSIGTAVRIELDVHAYLEDELRRALADETDWSTMAPHAWKAEHPESIRPYRQEERRQAADRKPVRRARSRLPER